MKNKNGRMLIALGLLLLLTALGMTVYNAYDEKRAGAESEKVLAQLDMSPTKTENDEIPDYRLNPNMEMPITEIDGHDYVGVLKIPAVDLELPIISRYSEDEDGLRTAPCRYSGSAYLRNMVIAGHDYRTHFGYISNLEPGDKIIFTDNDKNTFTYEVLYTEILPASATEEMIAAEGWDMTLFTCTYDGRSRITVRAGATE